MNKLTKEFFVFKGEISRKRFFIVWAYWFAISFVLCSIMGGLAFFDQFQGNETTWLNQIFHVFSTLFTIYQLIMAIPLLSITVRRAKSVGLNSLLLVLPILLVFVSMLLLVDNGLSNMDDTSTAIISDAILFLICSATALVVGFYFFLMLKRK